jgi:membrane fusion protein, multidrug efflux system
MNSYRKVLGALCALTLMLALAACTGTKKPEQSASARGAGAAVPVTVALAVKRDVPLEIDAIGTVEPINMVAVKSQIAGEITSVNFTEGQDVKKGQLLFTIDRRPLEADLRRAEATLAKDTATAANDKAQAERYVALAKQGVVATQVTDQMVAAARASQELIKADRAAVENARVQLQYTGIYSPIDGRTGNLAVQRGNIVKANDVPILVTINQINPIYVTFTIPEQLLPEVKRYAAGRKLKVKAQMPNDTHPAVGDLTFMDNTVDRQTGTIKLKGTFTNVDRRLWPGQFVNTTLTLTTQPNAITVPAPAVQTGQQGQYVYVVKQDKSVEQRKVQIERTLGQDAIVAAGVQPGETVVTDGQLRLTPASKVDIKSAPGQPGSAQPTTEAVNQGSRS